MSQESVADSLGLPRSAIAKIESGRRAVSSLELAEVARLFNRPIAWFFGEIAESADGGASRNNVEAGADSDGEEDVLVALFRLAPEVGLDEGVRHELDRVLRLCREGRALRRLLERDLECIVPVHPLSPPARTDEAVNQGETVARAERMRLGLGDAPIADMAELIVSQGIWASGIALPEGVSGLFLRHSSVGIAILANARDGRERKRFSYAHEYAHALMDRDGAVTVSRLANRHDLCEVRANAFAAAFLMPADGVREFIRAAGKGKPSRERHVVVDQFIAIDAEHVEPPTAERRHSASDQRLTYIDAALAAMHFRVNYEPMVFRLRNLGMVSLDEMNALRAKKAIANRLRAALGGSDDGDRDDERAPERNLEVEVLDLAIEAYRREEISVAKLRELAELFESIEGGSDAVLDFAEAAIDV